MLSCQEIITSTKKIKKNKETRSRDGSEETFEYRINIGAKISGIWEKSLPAEEVSLIWNIGKK